MFWIIHCFRDRLLLESGSARIISVSKILSLPFLLIISSFYHLYIKDYKSVYKTNIFSLLLNTAVSLILYLVNLPDFVVTSTLIETLLCNKLRLFIFIFFDIWGMLFITVQFWQIAHFIYKLKFISLTREQFIFRIFLATPSGLLISSLIIRSFDPDYFMLIVVLISIFTLGIVLLIGIDSYFREEQFEKNNIIEKTNNPNYINICMLATFIICISESTISTVHELIWKNLLAKMDKKSFYSISSDSMLVTLIISVFFLLFGLFVNIGWFRYSILTLVIASTSNLFFIVLNTQTVGIITEGFMRVVKDQLFNISRELIYSNIFGSVTSMKPKIDFTALKLGKMLGAAVFLSLSYSKGLIISNLLMSLLWSFGIFIIYKLL